MAAKSNPAPEQIDKSSFFWVGRCGICHPGGGPGEFDRWGQKYYDPRTRQWGFEVAGRDVSEVGLDGDYTFVAGSGVTRPAGHPTPPAQWDKTWTSEADCLLCHASKRVLDGPKNMNWIWRTATLRAMASLQDSQGGDVPAFMAAAAAGQGWFSGMEMAPPQPGTPPTATSLDIDYGRGLESGELVASADGEAVLRGESIVTTPRDAACWGCHATPDLKKRARIWFDPEKDVHYRHWSNKGDDDPTNDIPVELSQACTVCHTAEYQHQITKGDPFEGTVAGDHKFVDFLSCRDCHVDGNEHGAPVPSNTDIHRAAHIDKLACQTCHIPFKDASAQLVVDNATSGRSVDFNTDEFLSADPLDPGSDDKSKWWPSLHLKVDGDGVERIFPAKLLNTMWWGAWYHGTDGVANTADDFVRPVPLWRIRKITGGNAPSFVNDDNGDGAPELNTPDEIRAYVARLRNEPNAIEPGLGLLGANDPQDYVLIKGGRFWWLDGDEQTGTVVALSLHIHDTNAPDPAHEWLGARVESAVPFSIDHNVIDPTHALGTCSACHSRPAYDLLDRKILVDPWGPDAAATPVYETTGEILRREGYSFMGN